MISSLRDPERKEGLVDDKQPQSAQDPLTRIGVDDEERRPPVLAVVIAFIVLFWGALALGLIFWPR